MHSKNRTHSYAGNLLYPEAQSLGMIIRADIQPHAQSIIPQAPSAIFILWLHRYVVMGDLLL